MFVKKENKNETIIVLENQRELKTMAELLNHARHDLTLFITSSGATIKASREMLRQLDELL